MGTFLFILNGKKQYPSELTDSTLKVYKNKSERGL